jgi:UDP-glucose 4-epimerase
VRILVTGASGFSGSYVAAALAHAGWNVTALYRQGLGFARNLEGLDNLTLLHADLSRAIDLPGPFETVVHTAATSPAAGVTDDDIIRDNADASCRLVDAVETLGCRRFIYFSSLSVYGRISTPVVDEGTAIVEPDVYGQTKLLGEEYVAQRASIVASIALRLPGVLGPGAHRNWLSGVADKLHQGEQITAFNLDHPFNNACHVADLARLVVALSRQNWEGYDAVVLGARGVITVRAAIERLASAMGVPARINEVPATKPSFILSSERAILRWGYNPMEIGKMIERYGRDVSE